MAEKILIVDDDVDSLKLIGLMLQRNGYDVSAARSGSQALSKAEEEKPDLIILDVMMPDMNGLDVCRRLRTSANTSQIPIIMFTAKTLIDDKVKGFEAGADDYLTKPTHPAELASRVKAVLTRHASRMGSNGAVQPQGRIVGILGAKGGVGTTTVALNVAAALHLQRETTLLVETRPGLGSLGWLPGAKTSGGIGRLLACPAKDVSRRSVESEIITHSSGLRILPAAARPSEQYDPHHEDSLTAVVSQLQGLVRCAVLDMGYGLTPAVATLYPRLSHLVLVVEPNPVAVGMAHDLITELETLGENVPLHIVVVNQNSGTLQTPWHEIENILGRDIQAIIAANPDLAFQSLQSGTPMVLLQPSAIITGQFIKLAEALQTTKGG